MAQLTTLLGGTLTWFLFSTLALAEISTADKPIRKPPILLGVGEQRTLSFNGLKKYSAGSKAFRVLSLPPPLHPFTTSSNALMVQGAQPGFGELWIWTQNEILIYPIQTFAHSLSRDSSFLQSISQLEETEVILLGKRVLIRGTVNSYKEAAVIEALQKAHPKKITLAIQLSPQLISTYKSHLTHWLKKREIKTFKVQESAGTLWISGSSDLARLKEDLKNRFPLTQIKIEDAPESGNTIFLRIFILEIKRNSLVRLGLRWPTQYENAFVFSGNSLTSHISFPLTAEAMANDGSFHILAKPQLMLRSPGKSELFAGGEFPIKQASRFGPKVSWKSFGLQVDLEALSSSAHQVRLKISTHVSHLDEQIASDDIPGLRFNRLKTEIDAKFGLPVFLCGLLQQNKKERSKGLPLLKSIPILGKLFSSQDYLNEKSELVIVLIPHSIAPRPPEKNLGEFFAKGPAPPPRNWISPSQYSELRESSDFPWNVLR